MLTLPCLDGYHDPEKGNFDIFLINYFEYTKNNYIYTLEIA